MNLREKKIVYSFVGLILLSGLTYRQFRRDQAIGTAKPVDLPQISFVSKDADGLEISNGQKGKFIFQKEGGMWKLVKPLEALANADYVQSLLANLETLKATEIVVSDPDDTLQKKYQLNPSNTLQVSLLKGEEMLFSGKFGKQSGRGQLAMVEPRPEVFTVTGYTPSLYTRELKEWRDRSVFQFDAGAIAEFSIVRKGLQLHFKREDGNWTATAQGVSLARLNQNKVVEFLRFFSALNAEDIVTGKSFEETGLVEANQRAKGPGQKDSSQVALTFVSKDNGPRFVLYVGKTPVGSTQHYAKKEGIDVLYTLGGEAHDWILADATKFQEEVPEEKPKS